MIVKLNFIHDQNNFMGDVAFEKKIQLFLHLKMIKIVNLKGLPIVNCKFKNMHIYVIQIYVRQVSSNNSDE